MKYLLFFIVLSTFVSCGENQFEFTSCSKGYIFENGKCTDIDECLNNTHNCNEGFACYNTKGSFICSDINECSNFDNDCSKDADCLNLDGYYNCVCKEGFQGDGKNCVDIDECEENIDDCSDDAKCINKSGFYICSCNNGFSGDGKTCSDVNECNMNACSFNANCENTTGSYLCTCKNGYEGNGITCTEIFCGNNIVSSNEECDKNDLHKNSCITLGYSNGILKCNNDCTFLKEDCRITEQSGTIYSETSSSIAIDNEGNIFISGYTQGDFDGNTNINSECEENHETGILCYDLFLIKFDKFGIKQWTKQWGSDSNDFATSMVVDNSGNVFVAGYTSGLIAQNIINTSNIGLINTFLTKFNNNGEIQWSKQIEKEIDADCFDYSNFITVDNSGNVYLTGETDCNLGENINQGNYDLFFAKYDTNGNLLLLKQEGTTSSDRGLSIATDETGNIFITGTTTGKLGTTSNLGAADIFLIKYDSNGVKKFTKQFGSSMIDYPFEIKIDMFNYIYITGYSYGNFDNNSNLGSDDIILIKFDNNGEKQWSKQEGTNNKDVANSLDFDNSGNVYITGYTKGSLDGNIYSGNEDIFVSKFTQSGQKVWTKQFGTSLYDSGNAIAIGNNNSIYITGTTSGQLDWNFGFGQNDIFFTTIENQ